MPKPKKRRVSRDPEVRERTEIEKWLDLQRAIEADWGERDGNEPGPCIVDQKYGNHW